MNTYVVHCISTGIDYTITAKSSSQAKRIVCGWKGISPSDYWCGLANYSAKPVKA